LIPRYFGFSTDVDAVTYLMLANNMLHDLFPNIITVGAGPAWSIRRPYESAGPSAVAAAQPAALCAHHSAKWPAWQPWQGVHRCCAHSTSARLAAAAVMAIFELKQCATGAMLCAVL
jgi:hypothetical protein